MMIETARSLAAASKKPNRSIMFIGFDLEEVGLFGSRLCVSHPPVPLSRIALFITADMIGRSLGGICRQHVFVMGTEHAPWAAALDRRGGQGPDAGDRAPGIGRAGAQSQ